ncbi:hypothetical protein AAMO2058_000174100 [Amorphochlora amoebiformis]
MMADREEKVLAEANEKTDAVLPEIKTDLHSLLIAYLSVFIDMLGLSLIIPIIPFLALSFGADSTALGYIYASYNGAQMISVPITGWLSDRYGRKPMILASLFGSFVGFLVQGLATELVTFCMGRVITGIFGGSVPIVNAYICDTVPAAIRPKYFAQLGAVIIVAFMFGPGIGAGLAQFSLQTPMLVACATSGFGFALALFAFKEPEKKLSKELKESDETKKSSPIPQNSVKNAMSDGDEEIGEDEKTEETRPEYRIPVTMMLMAMLFYSWAFAGYLYYSGLLFFDLWGWESLEFGFTAMGVSVWTVFHQMSSFVVFQRKFGKHAALILGSICLGVGFLLLSLLGEDVWAFTGVPLLAISVALLGFGVALTNPAITSITSRYATKLEQGSILGRSTALRSVGSTIGPVVWGVLYGVDWRLVFQLCFAMSLLCTVIGIVVLRMNYSLPEHIREAKSPKIGKSSEPIGVEMSVRKLGPTEEPGELHALRNENQKLKKKLAHYQGEELSPDLQETLELEAQHNIKV